VGMGWSYIGKELGAVDVGWEASVRSWEEGRGWCIVLELKVGDGWKFWFGIWGIW